MKYLTFLYKKIKKIFFNKFNNYSVDIALRYFPVIDEIKRSGIHSDQIIEVGSGALGITPYLNKNIIGVDVNFNGETNKLLKKVRSNATKLPFTNKYIDCVISIDLLEHLSKKQRVTAIKEMIRIARKKIIIGFPSGKAAREEDLYIKNIFLREMGYNDRYINDHIKYLLPEINEITRLFKNNKIKIIKNVNIRIHRIILNTQISKSKFKRFISSVVFVVLIPFFRTLNFGNCYRYIIIVDLKN